MADLFGRYPRRMAGMYYIQFPASSGRGSTRQTVPFRANRTFGERGKRGRQMHESRGKSAFTSRSGYSSRKVRGKGEVLVLRVPGPRGSCCSPSSAFRAAIYILRRPPGPLSIVPDTLLLRLVCRALRVYTSITSATPI